MSNAFKVQFEVIIRWSGPEDEKIKALKEQFRTTIQKLKGSFNRPVIGDESDLADIIQHFESIAQTLARARVSAHNRPDPKP